MRQLLDITKALADENRIRILAMLEGGELCVCQILELLDIGPSTVSKHLFILKQARLIEGRKDGRWMHYRLPDADASQIARDAVEWVLHFTAGQREFREQAARRKAVLKIKPEVLCCKQRESMHSLTNRKGAYSLRPSRQKPRPHS